MFKLEHQKNYRGKSHLTFRKMLNTSGNNLEKCLQFFIESIYIYIYIEYYDKKIFVTS